MYGEMLREGWASEDKRREYYDYIHDEGERLSRLIDNVLQLARMTRSDIALEPRETGVAELVDGLRSKIAAQVERAGFALKLDCEDAASAAVVRVDPDAFAQILINLVDNALKFSARRRDAPGRCLVPARARRGGACSPCATTAPVCRATR